MRDPQWIPAFAGMTARWSGEGTEKGLATRGE